MNTLIIFGENIKTARLRRKISMEEIAERAGISRATVGEVEKGSPSVAMGTYIQVLFVLGLDKDFLKVASDDVLGRINRFILNSKGWQLSPAFDINPVPHGYGLSLNISENDNRLDTDIALKVAPYFRIDEIGYKREFKKNTA